MANRKLKKPSLDFWGWPFYILILLSVITIWIIFAYLIHPLFLKNPEEAGQFGDSFGVIASLFSALAFAGLIISIYIQRKELTETRNEFAKQNTNLKRQRFENTLFNMIEIHLSNLRSLEYKGQTGTRAIRQFVEIIIGALKPYAEGDGHEESRKSVYNDRLINKDFTHVISPYIRSLTAAYEIIVDSSLSQQATTRYVKILKAYLSSIEIEFLFYHSSYCKHNELTERELRLLNQFMIDSELIAETRIYLRSKRGLNL